jgi:hypothetical protein
MGRLIRLFVVLAFMVTQVASIEAAICRHGSSLAHSAALRSHDKRVSAEAFDEDIAGSVAAKKGSLADSGSPASDMLVPDAFAPPLRPVERVRIRLANAPPLAGTSIRPLLQPPLA